jgi:phosphoglycerate dehydrogenase-like enzyme
VHLVLSSRSKGLIGAAELAAMKPTALLVNTSRGPIVDDVALVDALRRKQIRAAAVDVFDHEPLATDHPLRDLDNAIVTPHIGYVTRELYETFYTDAVEDIAAFRAGRPIRLMQ